MACRLKRCWLAAGSALIQHFVQPTHQTTRECGKSLMNSADVFAEIDAARSETRHHLLVRCMASVINHNINALNLVIEPVPKVWIFLVPDEHCHGVAFVCFTCFLNINAVNMAFISKIRSPHSQTPATVYANSRTFTGLPTNFEKWRW